MFNHSIHPWARLGLAAIAASGLLAVESTASAQSSAKSAAKAASGSGGGSGGRMRVIESSNGTDGESHSVVIHIDNGKTAVKVDGKEVPAAQIREENGRLIVTDKDGNQIEAMQIDVLPGAAGQAWVFSAGDGDDASLWNAISGDASAVAAAAEEPKVMIGVHMASPGAALEHHLGLEPGKTTMISGLYEGLPAHAAGLAEYDVIVKVDGKSPADSATVRQALAGKNAGDVVMLSVIHEGKPREVAVKLAKYDADAMGKAKLIGAEPKDMLFDFNGALPEGALPSLRQYLVAPQGRLNDKMREEQLSELKRRMDKSRQMEKSGGGDVDGQIEKLDQRIGQLEELLRKYLEQESKKP